MDLYDSNPLIVNCCYVVFIIIALSSNGLLIYLITYKSPHVAWSMKAMLINISAVQILTALTATYLQGRLMVNSSTVAILSDGPARIFGPMTCLASYNIYITLTSYVELLIVHTMFIRYRMLQTDELKTAELVLSFAPVAIWPVMSLVFPFVTSPPFDIVMNEAIHEHPQYNLKRYGKFGGFKASASVISLMSLAIVMASPIFIFYLRRLILKTLNTYQQYTVKTVQSSKMFLKALTWQAIVPMLCYLPTILISALVQTFKTEIVVMEYLMLCFGALPSVIDPIITIYFVPSYRKWFTEKFRKRSLSTQVVRQSTIKDSQNAVLRVGTITTPATVAQN